jgi:hypothetical protein
VATPSPLVDSHKSLGSGTPAAYSWIPGASSPSSHPFVFKEAFEELPPLFAGEALLDGAFPLKLDEALGVDEFGRRVPTKKGESGGGEESKLPPAPPATIKVSCLVNGLDAGTEEAPVGKGVFAAGAAGLRLKALSARLAKSRRRKRIMRVKRPTRRTQTASAAPMKVRRFSPAPLETPRAAETQMAVAVVKPFTCWMRRPPDLEESSKPFCDMTPAPMKPTPEATEAAMRDLSPGIPRLMMVKIAAPRETRAIVRSPAGRSEYRRSKPMEAPANVAMSRRVIISNSVIPRLLTALLCIFTAPRRCRG